MSYEYLVTDQTGTVKHQGIAKTITQVYRLTRWTMGSGWSMTIKPVDA